MKKLERTKNKSQKQDCTINDCKFFQQKDTTFPDNLILKEIFQPNIKNTYKFSCKQSVKLDRI